MRTFKVSKLSIGFVYAIMALFVLVVLFVSPTILLGDGDPAGKVLFAIWSLGVIISVILNLKMPQSITLIDSQKILFNSIIANKEIEIRSIRKIATSPINSTLITFRYDNGKFTLLNRIDGLHELICEIKKVNPNLDTRGC